jgi:hypothetical protein
MMKINLFFICLIMSFLAHQSFSQDDSTKRFQGAEIDVRLDKGDFLLGGTLGLDLKAAENENQLLRTAINENSDKLNLRLDGAYALKDDWFVGLGFLWGVTNREGDYEDPNTGDISNIRFHSTSYSLRPFIKNHLPLNPNRRFNLVVQTELGVAIDQSIEESTANKIVTRKLTKEWGMGLGVRPGLLAFIMKNFAVEASVNIAGIGFSVTEINQTNEPDVNIRSADLDLKIDLLQLNLGFIAYF